MRRRAVERANDYDLGIEIQAVGTQSLPFDDESFDVIIVSLLFCTMPNVDAELGEVARVLNPDTEFRWNDQWCDVPLASPLH